MPPVNWNEIEEVFQAALDVPARERRAWLAARCGADTSLRREVESLLVAEGESEDFLRRPDFVRAVGSLLGSDEQADRAGQQLGPYRIVREVGRGGMGVVYEASRADGEFRQRVAVKLVKRGLDTDDILRRFRHERQILASLHHPNIASVFDGGTSPDGLPYFVMEYVEGQTLLQYCDERGLSTNERLRLFRKVCTAVQHAHRNLVVHRDLKPSNILVNDEGEVKLLDFGVAKLLDPERAGAALTGTHALRAMTPEYASPEQVRGEHVTTATDVYSLGAVLYELLTGTRPHRLRDTSPAEWSRAICDSQPSKPSQAVADLKGGAPNAQPATGNPKSLRGDIDNIVLKAMRKEPARRYGSVEQLSDDIERHLKGLPVVARRDTFRYRSSKFVARHKAGVAAGAVVLLAIVGGLVGTAWQARVAARERDQARREKVKAEQLNAFLQSILGAASPMGRGKDAKVLEVVADAAGRIDTEFAGQPELRAQALATIGKTYSELGLPNEAAPKLRQALDLHLQLHGEENPETVKCLNLLADALATQGNLAEGEHLLDRAQAAARKLGPLSSKELAFTLFMLGEIQTRKGDYGRAVELLQESIAIAERVMGTEDESWGFYLVAFGRAQAFSGDAGGAEATYRRAISMLGKEPRHHTYKGYALINLGHLLARQKRYDAAVAEIQEAENIFRQRHGDSYELAEARNYLSTAYFSKGDYAKAAEAAQAAVGLWRGLGLSEHTSHVTALVLLGRSLTRAGRARAAEPYLREALKRREKSLPPGDPLTHSATGALGECLAEQGRFAEAEPLVVGGYEGLKASVGEKHQLTAEGLERVVSLYEKWHRPEVAAKHRPAAN